MSNTGLSRRGALKYLGLLAASAAGREFLVSWLPRSAVRGDEAHHLVTIQGTADAEVPYTPQFFNADEFETVQLLTEMILPTDDEPGAKEAKVADYIDFVVFSAQEFEPHLQRAWIDGLTLLERESQKQFGKAFRNASESERVKLLTEMSLPERDPKARQEGYEFFRLVKEVTVEGFYTSKVGLIDVLNYQGMNYMSEFPGCTHPQHQS
jgi:gluconate 2-dehydrogenase subunit 3-like protein